MGRGRERGSKGSEMEEGGEREKGVWGQRGKWDGRRGERKQARKSDMSHAFNAVF